MTKRLAGTILVGLLVIQLKQPFSASSLRLGASMVYEQSVNHHLQHSQKQEEIELKSGELFEERRAETSRLLRVHLETASGQKPAARPTVQCSGEAGIPSWIALEYGAL